MGFLKSFFGAMAANEISERKRAESERQREEKERLNNSKKIIELSMSFYEYQMQINCRNASFKEIVSEHDLDNDNVSSYDVMRTEELFKGYKRQLKEFMSYGGDPQYICGDDFDSNKMDLYIEIVKRLKEYGWLDKQEEYVKYAEDTYWLDCAWEEEQKKRSWLTILFGLPNNEIKQVVKKECQEFIPYFDSSDTEAICLEKAYFAPFLHDGGGRPWDAPICIKFTNKYILFYDSNTHEEIYYKSTIANRNVEVLGTTFVTDWAGVSLGDVYVLFKMDELDRVQRFYAAHNSRIQSENNQASESFDSLSGIEFENVCKRLLENMGFSVETTKASGDGGIDLIAYNSQPLLSGKYIIQCKRYSGSVGEPIIRDLYGVVTSERANKGILLTTGYFTKSAITFAESKPLELIDGVNLKELIVSYL